MNFQNTIKTVIRNAASWAGVNVMHTSQADYLVNVIGNLNRSKATPQNALTYAPVFACVTKISSTIAALPFRVYENKGNHWAPFTNHPVNHLISTSPNEQQGKIDFMETLIASVLLWGNGYALIHKDHLMRTQSFEWIHASLVNPFKSNEGKLYYAVKNQVTGNVDILSPDEIIHVKDLSTDGISGRSRIRVNAEAIESGMAVSKFGLNFFENGANQSGTLETDKVLDNESVERLSTQFVNKTSGLQNAHKPLVLEEGLKWNRIGIPPNDAQFLETRQFAKEDIAMIFDVPPSIIGILVKTSYNSLEQQNIAFTQSLTPLVKKTQEEFTRKSFRTNEQGKLKTKMNFNSLLRGDIKTRVEAQWKWRQMGVFSANEIRELEGYAPRTDEGGNEYLKPLNLENASNPNTDGNEK